MKTAGCEHQIYSIAEDMLYALRSRVLTSRRRIFWGSHLMFWKSAFPLQLADRQHRCKNRAIPMILFFSGKVKIFCKIHRIWCVDLLCGFLGNLLKYNRIMWKRGNTHPYMVLYRDLYGIIMHPVPRDMQENGGGLTCGKTGCSINGERRRYMHKKARKREHSFS